MFRLKGHADEVSDNVLTFSTDGFIRWELPDGT
jgi:hypothetical protein